MTTCRTCTWRCTSHPCTHTHASAHMRTRAHAHTRVPRYAENPLFARSAQTVQRVARGWASRRLARTEAKKLSDERRRNRINVDDDDDDDDDDDNDDTTAERACVHVCMHACSRASCVHGCVSCDAVDQRVTCAPKIGETSLGLSASPAVVACLAHRAVVAYLVHSHRQAVDCLVPQLHSVPLLAACSVSRLLAAACLVTDFSGVRCS